MKFKNYLILFLITIFIVGCGKKEKDVIKIGAILPLTGNVAFLGKWIKNGLELGLHDEQKQNNVNTAQMPVVFCQ